MICFDIEHIKVPRSRPGEHSYVIVIFAHTAEVIIAITIDVTITADQFTRMFGLVFQAELFFPSVSYLAFNCSNPISSADFNNSGTFFNVNHYRLP